MEHAVADAGHHRAGQQHPVVLGQRIAERSHAEQPQADEQNRSRSQLVDDEARRRLDNARDDEKGRQHRTQLNEADVELVLQPREQRREHQLAEMADCMGQSDQADELRVGLEARCGHLAAVIRCAVCCAGHDAGIERKLELSMLVSNRAAEWR